MIWNAILCGLLVLFCHFVTGIEWGTAILGVMVGDTWWTVNQSYY